MAASSQVRENIGKAALMRGPVVYCLEETDNGRDLHLLSIREDTAFTILEKEIQGTAVKAIQADGCRRIVENSEGNELYHPLGEARTEQVVLKYIPYYTWANRGENEMQVWTAIEKV